MYGRVVHGLLHLSNLTFQSVDATMQQVFYALILGFALSFIRLLTNGLWVGILLHSLIDFQPTIATGGSAATNWGSLLLIFLPLFVISLLWLWFADRLLLKKKGEAPFS
ncbi:type II CAAX prenyl endopeptidase Rce1 family protein [Limosilactobacillus fermentum]|uniref:CPBP family glutamic-type intramembrane protease n=1 Tax=Limosilactobacillus fermentum TaxID=1613 RepID=UPI003B68190B